MASTKVTFMLDEATLAALELAATQTEKSKSKVVREAIAEYHQRHGRLAEEERLERLKLFDLLVSQIPKRDPADTQRELDEIRAARRSGGRRTPVE